MTTDARTRRSLFLTMLRGSMRARRGRLALAAAAIAIGTSVAAALLLVSIDVGRKVTSELRAYGPNLVLAPAAGEIGGAGVFGAPGALGGEPRLDERTATWLEDERRTGRIGSAATMRYHVGRVGGRPLVVVGTSPMEYVLLLPKRTTAKHWLRRYDASDQGESAILSDADCLLGARAAERLGIRAGSPLSVEFQTERGPRTLAIERVVILETGGPEDQLLVVPAHRLDAVLGSHGRFHLALARADGDAAHVLAYAKEATKRAPGGALPAGAALRPITRLTEADGRMLHRIRLLLILVSAVALVAAALCATSTLADLVLERTQEIALLRSLGANSRELLALFLGEAATLGLVGGIAGLAIGLVAAQAIGFGVFGSSIRLAPIVPPVALALGVAIALLAAIVPVKHALAIEPARVLRGE